MGLSGSLEKMTITAYSDDTFKRQVGQPFPVLINPESYTHNFKICYNPTQAQGSNGGSPNFNKIPSDTASFELVFDGTGVVPGVLPDISLKSWDGITSQITAFKALVFDYNGNIHSPNFLKLTWGTFLFKCRLSSIHITYTLFKPDGTPLRARADCSFLGFNDEVELALMAKKSSPDLTHLVTIKEGDTLPLLCDRIYGTSAYYLQVARANALSDFRRLVPGTQLLFPPLAQAPE